MTIGIAGLGLIGGSLAKAYKNVGHTVSNWIEGTSIVTNEDGIYIDPTGQSGTTLAPDEEERIDMVNPAELIDEYKDDFSIDESKEGE